MVEILNASQVAIAKPAIRTIQNKGEIIPRYPSWNMVKRVMMINRITSARFRIMELSKSCITCMILFVITFLKINHSLYFSYHA
jgi:hypothetical protein